jgi:hypothetical protein
MFGGAFSESVRLTGRALRDHVLRLAEKFADDGKPVQLIYVETNQGGDLWEKDIFSGSPIRVRNVHQSIKKEVRAAQALAYYQRGRVEHVPGAVRTGEEQMVSVPERAARRRGRRHRCRRAALPRASSGQEVGDQLDALYVRRAGAWCMMVT